jgi:chemotaxis protein MotB
LADKVSTTISRRGLKVRLLTDKLLFDSGSATLRSAIAIDVLDKIGAIIATEREHPVEVEGHTDDRPIATSQFPSNWQLSGARAGAVVQRVIGAGVAGSRVSLGGYAARRPAASNASAGGRARNRRVEIVLTRLHGAIPSQGGDIR